MSTSNPLMAESWGTPFEVPPIDRIADDDYLPAFVEGMRRQRDEIDAIISSTDAPTFDNTIVALERSGKLLSRVAHAFYPRHSAHTNDRLQEVAREVAPLLSAHADDIRLNPTLFDRIRTVYEGRDQLSLDPEQQHLLNETYKSFARGGIHCSEEVQARLRQINTELSRLANRFGDNLLEETNEFELVVEDPAILEGLPSSLVAAAAAEGQRRKRDGRHVFTLQRPSIDPFLQYCDDREQRRAIAEGYALRGDNDNEHDNKAVVARIVELRAERAELLGYDSHAHFALEDRMAETPDRVFALLEKVWAPAIRVAEREARDLEAMMEEQEHNGGLGHHDWPFYAEKLRRARYDLDDETVRPYLEVNAVRDGAFQVATRLFALTFEPRDDLPVWHPDQQAFEVKDADGSHLGLLYMDFFARESKRAGAWANTLRQQSNLDGRVTAIVTTNFNFPAPTDESPSLLNFVEATTLFHEFGHALHNLLSDVTYASLSGTSVPRDYVEFPSQVLENWLGEPEVLRTFARHYRTGEPIPTELIEKLQASMKFNQGFQTVEYLAASYLDMHWHTLKHGAASIEDVRRFESEAMARLGLIDAILPRYRSTYFAHVFSGGYSAGYYSYLWAEVLDADGYEAFRETSLFDRSTASRLRRLLSRGGSRPGMELYREFRGRDPEIEPLLVRRGLA
jgi:peptidyl-dipeptidase Dcp